MPTARMTVEAVMNGADVMLTIGQSATGRSRPPHDERRRGEDTHSEVHVVAP